MTFQLLSFTCLVGLHCIAIAKIYNDDTNTLTEEDDKENYIDTIPYNNHYESADTIYTPEEYKPSEDLSEEIRQNKPNNIDAQKENNIAMNGRREFLKPKGIRRGCKKRCKKLKTVEKKSLRERDLIKSWNNQLRVVEKIVNHMENIQRQKKTDFEDLLEEMKTKRTTRSTTRTTEKTTTVMIPTELMVIEETEVREALKKDPLVRRILQMARMKRDEFFEGLKENNITMAELDKMMN